MGDMDAVSRLSKAGSSPHQIKTTRHQVGCERALAGFTWSAEQDAVFVIGDHRSVEGNVILRLVVEQRPHRVKQAKPDLIAAY